ncbi:Polysialic acid transport protein KpsD [Rahnella aquatilis]|nr:Polysialic acid transport protein KpsD [Rahnella aquatilis]
MKLLKSIVILLAFQLTQANAVGINADPNMTGAAPLPTFLTGQTQQTSPDTGFDDSPPPPVPAVMSRMFGAQLFTGGAAADNAASIGFNPNYIVGLGDQVQIRLWGAFNFDGALTVDPKGNIFLPNVGPLKVAGVSNSQLNSVITTKVKQVY